jgi:hypothetical protein
MTLGASLLIIGAAALLQAGRILHLAPVQFLALGLTIIGVGLLIGTFWGRARWLIAPGVALLPLVLAASLIHVPLAGGVGDRAIRPATLAQVEPAYRLVSGQLILDLRAVEVGTVPVSIRATDMAGRLVVLVPSGVMVDVRARSGAGEVSLFGQTYDGLGVDVRRTYPPAIPAESVGQGEFVLDLETSFGQVVVQR